MSQPITTPAAIATASETRLRRALTIAGRILGYLLLAPLVAVAWFGLLRLGLAPQYIAQVIVAFVGPIVLLLLLVGTAVTFRRWWKTRHKGFLAVFLIAGSGLLACGYTLGAQLRVASTHGISINPLATLWPRLPVLGDARGHSVIYDHFNGQDVRLYLYRPPVEPSGGAPVLVYVHGGGWVQGENRQRERDLRWFADQGYLVVGIDYSLSSAREHLWNITQPQIACALAWVGANAKAAGGNPARLAMIGESAGGNLVLNIGNLANAGRLASRCGGSVPRVDAVIPIYPPVDMVALYAHPAAAQYPLAYIGGSPAQYPERYAAVSPIRSISPSNPAALILTGLDDSLVPVADTLRYVDSARAAGVEIELIGIPRMGHGFDMLPGSIGNQIVRSSALQFLARHKLAP